MIIVGYGCLHRLSSKRECQKHRINLVAVEMKAESKAYFVTDRYVILRLDAYTMLYETAHPHILLSL